MIREPIFHPSPQMPAMIDRSIALLDGAMMTHYHRPRGERNAQLASNCSNLSDGAERRHWDFEFPASLYSVRPQAVETLEFAYSNPMESSDLVKRIPFLDPIGSRCCFS